MQKYDPDTSWKWIFSLYKMVRKNRRINFAKSLKREKNKSREKFLFSLYDSIREEIIAGCFSLAKAVFFSSV